MIILLAFVGLVTVLAAAPVDTRPMRAHPHPIVDYAHAVAAYDSLRAAERDTVVPAGASLMYSHGAKTPRAVVLFHGLTNSPRQFVELGQRFYERGYNVIIPRMPEHGLRGADIASLKRLTAERFRDYADQAIDVAVGLGDSVFVIGLSGGGNVAAWLVEERSDVTRVLVVAPAIRLGPIPGVLATPTMNMLGHVPNITIHQQADTARPHAYFGISTRGLAETLRFGASIMRQADDEAPRVRDVTMVLNPNDRTIDAGTSLELVDRWSRRDSVAARSYWFDAALGLPHDVIDVTQACGMPAFVYDVLVALMEKRPPPTPDGVASRCAPR